ncbi:MAG: helix-turn-helix domain-containing protein [Candidatus Dojkabacteria bacterium]
MYESFNAFYTIIYRLEEIRKEKEMTQEKLSEFSGIPRPEISKILSGKVSFSLERLLKVVYSLEASLEVK